MSASEEPEPDMEQANKKKVRGESSTPSAADSDEAHDKPTPLPQAETREVTEVTQGVKDVELDASLAPESVPLPNEESDDFEESSSNATPPLETQSQRDTSSLHENALPQDEPVDIDETAVVQEATTLEKGKERQETSVVVEGDVPAPDATTDVPKSEPKRTLQSKTNDASSAQA